MKKMYFQLFSVLLVSLAGCDTPALENNDSTSSIIAHKLVKDAAFLELYHYSLTLNSNDLTISKFRQTATEFVSKPYVKNLINEILSKNSDLIQELSRGKSNQIDLMTAINIASRESNEIHAITRSFYSKNNESPLNKTSLEDVCSDQKRACNNAAFTAWVVTNLGCGVLLEAPFLAAACVIAAEANYVTSIQACSANYSVCIRSNPK